MNSKISIPPKDISYIQQKLFSFLNIDSEKVIDMHIAIPTQGLSYEACIESEVELLNFIRFISEAEDNLTNNDQRESDDSMWDFSLN